MALSNLGGWYMALSTDMVDGKVDGAIRIGAPIYFVDTYEWKQVGEDTVVRDFHGFPFQLVQPLESNGAIPVNIQDQTSRTVDLYLMDADSTVLTITSPIVAGDETIAISDNTGVVAGHAICVQEGEKFFQTIVVSSTANEVTLASPCDMSFTVDASLRSGAWNMSFTVDASLRSGAWNMALDGSTNEKVFCIHPPVGADYDIYAITISGLDDLEMDSTTFMGIADGITSPMVIRKVDGDITSLGLFANNLGFEEQGFAVEYRPANKHSEYGLIARKNFHENNGVSIRLYGESEDKIEVINRSDLSSQSLIAVVMHGHVVTN